jgi:RNA polymerase sigma-70 factor (ECF subfamily)
MLVDTLLSHLGEVAAAALRGSDDVARWLEEATDSAAREYPELRVPTATFIERIATCLASLPTPSMYRKLHTTDLYLACACMGGDKRAIIEFEKRYSRLASHAIGRLRVPAAVADDIIGGLPARLFVGAPEGGPLIAKYEGRSALATWVRSVVVHAALNAQRAEHRHTGIDDAEDLVEPRDPEGAYLKKAYGEEFRAALQEAMASLSDRERNVLRQRFLDGLNIDALGQLYGVHRATAARWVADACESVLAQVRTNLARRIRVSEDELDTIIRAGRGELDTTLSGLLRTKS